ncbi:hypothetical protein ACER1D_004137 [Vibrio alginolyticus]
MTIRTMIIMTAILVSGCATKPLSNAESKPVPSERILDAQYLSISEDKGVVTVKRDEGFGGSACTSRIFVNGKPIADLNPAEKVVLYLPADEYIISAWPNGICGGGMVEVQANVKVESRLNFRVGYGSNGDFSIFPTAF